MKLLQLENKKQITSLFDKTCVIEASAGTGKTTSITHILVHALLYGIPIDEILVVTFTDAATKELRGRIRDTISVIPDYISLYPNGDEKDLLYKIVSAYIEKGKNIRKCAELVKKALLDIDRANIFTIHGFCQRLLIENAFESKLPYDMELIPDQSELVKEFAENFWRNIFLRHTDSSDKWDKYVSHLESFSLETVCTWVDFLVKYPSAFLQNPYTEIEIGAVNGKGDNSKKEFENKVFSELLEFFSREYPSFKMGRNILTFEDLLVISHEILEKERYSVRKPLTRLIRSKYRLVLVDEFQDTDPIQYGIFKMVFGMQECTNGLFMIGDPKQSIYRFRNADIFCYLEAKKDANKVFTLGTNYRSEKRMLEAVNKFFGIRSDIFVFSKDIDGEGIEYSDLEAGADRPELISKDESLSVIPLHFFGVEALKKKDAVKNVIKETVKKISHLLEASRKGKLYFDDGRKTPVSPGDISILVNTNEQATAIKKELSESGIPAVIYTKTSVFKTKEADDILAWLKAVSNPVEFLIRPLFVTNLFGPMTAEEIFSMSNSEILRISDYLYSLNKNWQKNGFFKSFFNFFTHYQIRKKILAKIDGERIYTNYMHIAELIHSNENINGKNIEKSIDYLRQRMSAKADSEEYIQRLESDQYALKVMTIHKAKGLEFKIVFCPFLWAASLSERGKKIISFSERITLESEEKIRYRRKIVFNPDEATKNMAFRENLAEQIRLIYVALTRAVNKCYIALPVDKGYPNNEDIKMNAPAASAFYFIFTEKMQDEVIEDMTKKPRKKGDVSEWMNDILRGIEKLACNNRQYIYFEYPSSVRTEAALICEETKNEDVICIERDADISEKELSYRKLTRKVFSSWSVGSFSELASLHPYRTEEYPEEDKFSLLPKGKVFGNIVHKIMQNYFTTGKKKFFSNEEELFRLPLMAEPFFFVDDIAEREQRINIVRELITMALTTPLQVAGTPPQPVILENISPADAKPEFEFFYKIKKISPYILSEVFSLSSQPYMKNFSGTVESLKFYPFSGYMKGDIDLFFRVRDTYYIVDWKTNHLGPNKSSYSPENIIKNMEEHCYFLQAYIYLFAAHLFLKANLKTYSYEENFGGIYYIYMRGVGETNCGIFFEKPPYQQIVEMEKLIL